MDSEYNGFGSHGTHSQAPPRSHGNQCFMPVCGRYAQQHPVRFYKICFQAEGEQNDPRRISNVSCGDGGDVTSLLMLLGTVYHLSSLMFHE